jgi:transcriptional regulator with XRE-family HTH domain
MTPRPDPVTRLKARISAALDATRDRPLPLRKTQVGLADACNITKQTLNEQLNGPNAQRGLLVHLDQIAEYLETTPTALVQQGDTALVELAGDEQRLIKHWRHLSLTTRIAVMDLLAYFDGLLPEEREERRWWQEIRRIKNPRDLNYLRDTIADLIRRQQRTGRNGVGAPSGMPSGPARAPATHPRRPHREKGT